MTKHEIQRAVPEDGAALFALLELAYQPYRDRGITLPDVTEGLLDEIEAGRVWVAKNASGHVGILNLSLLPPTAHLFNVAVSSAAKGRGVGGALIRHAIVLAKEAGCDAIDLATHSDLAENVSLYEHFGWHVVGHEDARVRMRLPL